LQNYARQWDLQDPLKSFRNEFEMPSHQGKDLVYFCGNSLGLLPKATRTILSEELEAWSEHGVEGHFKGARPWVSYHKLFQEKLSKLVGARPEEVVAMNSLTTNLHLALATFYKPTSQRYLILTEDPVFSSDVYALKSQINWHGKNATRSLMACKPREGQLSLRTEDIIKKIESNKGRLALVFFGAVNYYNGQAYDIEKIAKAAHKAGAKIGLDLAHAIGNVPLELHKWNVDFAVWCSYKYLNAGPGAVGGMYIHNRHFKNKKLFRLAGWWGHQESDRFKMKGDFKPAFGIEGWQLSNAPVFNMAGLMASLDIFHRAGIKNIVKKSRAMTKLLEEQILLCNNKAGYKIKLITPGSIDERGCQLSIFAGKDAAELHQRISKAGFVTDLREPGVIRVAPVPLYNKYEEIIQFSEFLKKWCYYKK
jgi:kynureninase